jgi:hypothetical protein
MAWKIQWENVTDLGMLLQLTSLTVVLLQWEAAFLTPYIYTMLLLL